MSRIRFVMEGTAWSMSRKDAVAYGRRQMDGDTQPIPDLKCAKRLRYRGDAHEAYECTALNCFHPLDWDRLDWSFFLADLAIGDKPND